MVGCSPPMKFKPCTNLGIRMFSSDKILVVGMAAGLLLAVLPLHAATY